MDKTSILFAIIATVFLCLMASRMGLAAKAEKEREASEYWNKSLFNPDKPIAKMETSDLPPEEPRTHRGEALPRERGAD